MLPLHRIVSYNEDLEFLLMLTREGDEDRENLQRSFDRVSSLCSKLQDKLVRAQELEELWVLQQATRGTYSSFLEPNRRIVIQDWAVLAGQLGEKKRSMVLFNDGLVCLSSTESEEEDGTIKKQMSSRYKYDYKWIDNLIGASVSLGTSKMRGQFYIVFKSSRKDYTFYFTDRAKQQQWCTRRANCATLMLRAAASCPPRYEELIECIKNVNSGRNAGDAGDMSLGDYLLGQDDLDIGALKSKHWDPERPRPSFKFGLGLEKLFQTFDDSLISLAQYCALRLSWSCLMTFLTTVPSRWNLRAASLHFPQLAVQPRGSRNHPLCISVRRLRWSRIGNGIRIDDNSGYLCCPEAIRLENTALSAVRWRQGRGWISC